MMKSKRVSPNIFTTATTSCICFVVATLVFFMLNTITSCEGSREGVECVNLPSIPFQASFSITGWFKATFKCPSPGEDIALNAPGKRGVLLCDPHSHFNYDLKNVRRPDCHPRMVPDKIKLTTNISYLVPDCMGEAAEARIVRLKKLLQKNFMDVDEPCGYGQPSCVPKSGSVCDVNAMYPESSYGFQLDVHFTMTTQYIEPMGLDFYRDVVEATRRRVGHFGGDTNNHAMWQVDEAEFLYIQVSSWSGVCEEQSNSTGVDLELDGMVTCRGCSKKYVLYQGGCLPCMYNTYTAKPFQASCQMCPREKHWEDPELMKDLCYMRP